MGDYLRIKLFVCDMKEKTEIKVLLTDRSFAANFNVYAIPSITVKVDILKNVYLENKTASRFAVQIVEYLFLWPLVSRLR